MWLGLIGSVEGRGGLLCTNDRMLLNILILLMVVDSCAGAMVGLAQDGAFNRIHCRQGGCSKAIGKSMVQSLSALSCSTGTEEANERHLVTLKVIIGCLRESCGGAHQESMRKIVTFRF